jgi:1-acyl-sn-glycerol-3-phosphate acyltransferase
MRDPRGQVLGRRTASVTVVLATAWLLTVFAVPLGLVLAAADLVRGKFRLPLVRLAAFGWCWAWLETAGVTAASWLWLTGRRGDVDAHYRLQRWWAHRLMVALRGTCGITIEVDGAELLAPGPTVLLVRHSSLADSLLTAWVVTEHAGMRPRVVLKRELLSDPCLDIVGNRLPNCFLDRGAEDAAPGLAELTGMGATMDGRSVAIIFPEGTRSNPDKRRRALERIAERDPGRAERLAGLRHVLPPRPAGTRALLRGAQPTGAGVVVGWHVGFDGLDTFAGILAALGRAREPIRMRFARVDPPPEDTAAFERWLDDLWCGLDRDVEALGNPPPGRTG